jgi:hypothetical protein
LHIASFANTNWLNSLQENRERKQNMTHGINGDASRCLGGTYLYRHVGVGVRVSPPVWQLRLTISKNRRLRWDPSAVNFFGPQGFQHSHYMTNSITVTCRWIINRSSGSPASMGTRRTWTWFFPIGVTWWAWPSCMWLRLRYHDAFDSCFYSILGFIHIWP